MIKRRKYLALILGVALVLQLAGCDKKLDNANNKTNQEDTIQLESADEVPQTDLDNSLVALNNQSAEKEEKAQDYMQYMVTSDKEDYALTRQDKCRTFYEVFVYSFYDSNQDGIGDLKGLTEKLDYLNDGDASTEEDLGITGIWLMPIMPSDTYHKYDVKDYMEIDASYGNLEDFENLIKECHERNINVIIDLVMNHTSSKHPWFVQAKEYLQALGDGAVDLKECPYVDYYHFSKETKGGYVPLEGTDWYYEANFWSEMPDLNLENENVKNEFEEITRFWLSKGVDGFRLDAVKEFESGNAGFNIQFLQWFDEMVSSINPDAYIVGEAWMDQAEYAKYYKSGMDSFFDFAFADNDGIISSVVNGKSSAITYGINLEKEEALYAQYYADYVNAPFYTNHDLGRSAGYYSGDDSERQTKIAQAMNLFASGNTFLYYGEEIGMKGAGADENKRLAMRWNEDSQAEGMCNGPKDAEKVKQKYESVEKQIEDKASILQFVRAAIKIRNQYQAIAKGKTTCIEELSGDQICVLKKETDTEKVLLIYNLSGEDQIVDEMELVKKCGKVKVAATLVTGNKEISENGKEISMPAYSVIVFELQD